MAKRLVGGIMNIVLMAECSSDSFTDRFERLDSNAWIVADGWSNGPAFLSDWRRGQVRADRTGLTVTLDRNLKSSGGYSSGEIQSRKEYRFGYYEVRMTAASGSGVDTGFFVYTGPAQGATWNEIDVEVLGKNTHAVQLTYHVGNQQRATTLALPFDASAGSHSFGFDWQPTYVSWYVDGALVHTERGQTLPLPDAPQRILFDVWNSDALSGWMGRFVWPGHPIEAHVQCIARQDHFGGIQACK